MRPIFYRKNLNILLNTRVHRILFDERTQAVGVIVSEDNFKRKLRTIKFRREVILSAGTFHTPQILKLSGIGSSKELNRFKIPVEYNSSMVGRNLYDHISMPLYVTINESMTITSSKVLSVKEILNYLLHGRGVLSNFGVIGYINSYKSKYGVGIFGVVSIDERVLRRITNTEQDVCISIKKKIFSQSVCNYLFALGFSQKFPIL